MSTATSRILLEDEMLSSLYCLARNILTDYALLLLKNTLFLSQRPNQLLERLPHLPKSKILGTKEDGNIRV
jgi:hypothetical protein